MFLARMIEADEEALVCDLAETYHIYAYEQLPATKVAVFAVGLRDDSRIKMKMSGQLLNMEQLLLVGLHDRVSLLWWAKTKDGQKGVNRPKSLMDTLSQNKREPQELVFESGEEFKKARESFLERIGGESE